MSNQFKAYSYDERQWPHPIGYTVVVRNGDGTLRIPTVVASGTPAEAYFATYAAAENYVNSSRNAPGKVPTGQYRIYDLDSRSAPTVVLPGESIPPEPAYLLYTGPSWAAAADRLEELRREAEVTSIEAVIESLDGLTQAQKERVLGYVAVREDIR